MSTSPEPPSPQDQHPHSNARHIKLVAAGVVAISVGLLIPLYRARPPRIPSAGKANSSSLSSITSPLAPAELLARRQRLGAASPAHLPISMASARPKAFTAAEEENAAAEVGLGFNPAAHTFGAFGMATLLVFAVATGSVYAIQRKTEAKNLEEFSAYMRRYVQDKFPRIRDRLYASEDLDISSSTSAPAVPWQWDQAEQRLETAYREGGLSLWANQAFRELEAERRQDSEDRSVSILIQQALTASLRLELFPKSIIDVYINVLENDGIEGCISAGTVAASTALAHAGVEMVGLVMSCTASIVGNDAWVDPTAEESRQATGTVLVSCIPAVGTVTNTWQTGQLTSEQMLRVGLD
ncbi:hypothetical protein FRB96_000419 [Tulasnella sp. 330]|nr:hypothetical protein FRB96_000419 [Tulasnella sp. 330]KAG8890973.1 hypothetical protein FRB98_002993 [Tulasnella sp. 332]